MPGSSRVQRVQILLLLHHANEEQTPEDGGVRRVEDKDQGVSQNMTHLIVSIILNNT